MYLGAGPWRVKKALPGEEVAGGGAKMRAGGHIVKYDQRLGAAWT